MFWRSGRVSRAVFGHAGRAPVEAAAGRGAGWREGRRQVHYFHLHTAPKGIKCTIFLFMGVPINPSDTYWDVSNLRVHIDIPCKPHTPKRFALSAKIPAPAIGQPTDRPIDHPSGHLTDHPIDQRSQPSMGEAAPNRGAVCFCIDGMTSSQALVLSCKLSHPHTSPPGLLIRIYTGGILCVLIQMGA